MTFSSNEAGVEFECSIDNGPFDGCEATVELTGLQPGSHSVRSRAIDEAGNRDLTPASHSWTISPAPNTTLTATPPNPSPGTTALFSFTSNQTGSWFECSLDDGEWLNCSSPHLVSFSDPEDVEGDHTFRVRAVNPVNPLSFDATPSTISWRVGLAPGTTITLAEVIIPDPTDPAPTLRLGFTGSDDLTNPIELEFECRLDSATFETCSAPAEYDLTTLTPGPHRFEVRAVDGGGSFDASPARHDFTVEPAPDTTILTGPDPVGDGVTATSATFTFDSNVAGATFECRLDLDPAGFTTCASGVTYAGLALGEHLLEVRRQDAGGHGRPGAGGVRVVDRRRHAAQPPRSSPGRRQRRRRRPTRRSRSRSPVTANGGSPLTYRCSLERPRRGGTASLRRHDRTGRTRRRSPPASTRSS